MLERDDEDLAVEHLRGHEHLEQPGEHVEPRIARRARERLGDLNARVAALTSERGRVERKLEALAAGEHKRFGHRRDHDAVERAHLESVLDAVERELRSACDERSRHSCELGDPRATLDGCKLERALVERALGHVIFAAARPERRAGRLVVDPHRDRHIDVFNQR
jgi:hypothetical protein